MGQIVVTNELEEAKRKLDSALSEFETKKREIDEFSKREPCFRTLTKSNLRDTAWFGESKVTVSMFNSEVNEFKSDVQSLFSNQKDHIVSIYREFRDVTKAFSQVYNVINSLNKDYITAILGTLYKAENAIENNERTLEDLKRTQGILDRNVLDVKNTQEVLKKSHDVLRAIVEKLQQTKQTLESQIANLDSTLNGMQQFMRTIDNNLQQTKQSLGKQIATTDSALKSMQQFVRTLDNSLQQSKQTLENKISQIEKTLSESKQSIEGLRKKEEQDFSSLSVRSLQLESLVSTLGSSVNALKEDIKSIRKSFETESEELRALEKKHLDALSVKIAECSNVLESVERKQAQALQALGTKIDSFDSKVEAVNAVGAKLEAEYDNVAKSKTFTLTSAIVAVAFVVADIALHIFGVI